MILRRWMSRWLLLRWMKDSKRWGDGRMSKDSAALEAAAVAAVAEAVVRGVVDMLRH